VYIVPDYNIPNPETHYYWIGSHLANGYWIQVGYLTAHELPRGAWFYCYLPPVGGDYVVVKGPDGSAGSAYTYVYYSAIHVGDRYWSFVKGSGEYLGTEFFDVDSTGYHAPASIAEKGGEYGGWLKPVSFYPAILYKPRGSSYFRQAEQGYAYREPTDNCNQNYDILRLGFNYIQAGQYTNPTCDYSNGEKIWG